MSGNDRLFKFLYIDNQYPEHVRVICIHPLSSCFWDTINLAPTEELTVLARSDTVITRIYLEKTYAKRTTHMVAREELLLHNVTISAEDPEHDEIKVTVKAPMIALSRAQDDFRECPDPVLFGYPDSSLDMMNLDDFHAFVYQWFERAVAAGMGRCFVCNKLLDMGTEKPWDAVFVTNEWHCWMLVHFDCKKYLNRDLKGRNPFEVTLHPPEFFDLRLTS